VGASDTFATHVARFRPAGYELKTRRRKMMALIDDQMAVVRHHVGYFTSAHETLDQRDINDASRLAASGADNADVLRIDIEECP
jgi:hypothetical protein